MALWRPFGPFMGPFGRSGMKRYHVNKRKSAKRFGGQLSKTKAPNLSGAPMRGGIRL